MKRDSQFRPRPRLRQGLRRGALLTYLVGLGVACLAGPAHASISISSFSVTPSTPKAGGAPNLKLVGSFSTRDDDTPRNLTISLAPGLLANPRAAAMCSSSEFAWDSCPPASRIGDGFVTGSVPLLFGSITAPLATNAYLVAPASPSALPQVGLIVNVFGFDVDSLTAPLAVRTTPSDLGVDLDVADLPDSYDGIPIIARRVNLTIFGSDDGKPLTRNPTSCRPAVTELAATSWRDPSQTLTASSSFTPTGCNLLGYDPQLAATATLDSGDAGVKYSATITQNPSDAATQTLTLQTPSALAPNLPAIIADDCTLTTIRDCPSIGTATATTPLLSTPVSAKLVLISHPGALPTPEILLSAPIAVDLAGTINLNSDPTTGVTTFTATFGDLPDIPLSSLTITFPGGPASLFIARAAAICSGPQPTSGTFIGQNGAKARRSVATTIIGCPASSSSTAPASATVTSARAAAATAITPRNAPPISTSRPSKTLPTRSGVIHRRSRPARRKRPERRCTRTGRARERTGDRCERDAEGSHSQAALDPTDGR